MDLSLVQANTYELPTSRRVGVIVHDGAADLRLWPAPGPDRELLTAFGADLPRVLEAERARAGGALAQGALLRLIPGRLHCDFLIWVASRPPEKAGQQAPAPVRETLEQAVRDVLDFVRERNVIRIAFPALGAGPGALDDAERLAIIARACTAYYDDCLATGKSNPIEEVVLCHSGLSVVTAARRKVGQLAKLAIDKPAPTAAAPKVAKKAVAKAPGARRGAPRLDEAEIMRARVSAKPWDRSARYMEGHFFVHAKFGVGRVTQVTPDGFIVCLFQDGETRRLIHQR